MTLRSRYLLACSCFFATTMGSAVFPAAAQSDPVRIYVDQGCAVCHGLIGHGGVGPAFVGDPFLAFKDYVVAQILLGRGQMPAFAGRLSNEQIATVASYIRNAWGNRFGPVNPDEIVKTHQEITLHPPANRPHLPPVSVQPNNVDQK